MTRPFSQAVPQRVEQPSVWPKKNLFARVPWYGYAGLLLNGLSWASSWSKVGPSAYTFFPLWFGFILVLDGLVYATRGTSMLRRSPKRFALLFALSSPFWWVFEGLNAPVQNWHYHFDHPYSPLAYAIIASLDFSTVLPAVFELTELVGAIRPLRPRLGPREIGTRLSLRQTVAYVSLGLALLILPILLPRYAFWSIWLCLIFVVDPINNRLGRKSTAGHLYAGDWKFLFNIPLATILCGFFWEMWNFYALPKWTYTVPFLNTVPKVFEMPFLGMLGYLPFGLELFAMYQFALLLLGQRNDNLNI